MAGRRFRDPLCRASATPVGRGTYVSVVSTVSKAGVWQHVHEVGVVAPEVVSWGVRPGTGRTCPGSAHPWPVDRVGPT